MTDGADELKLERGAPLIATLPRMAGVAAAEALVAVGLTYAYASISGSKAPPTAFVLPVLGAWALAFLATFAMLRAEESRLARELRTARAGTEMMRSLVLRRREKMPIFLRLFATSYGTAAVLVSEGERTAALDTLASSSPVLFGGRLRELREVIEIDADRTTGSPATLERCVERLRAMPPFGNLEADRYKTHVLVKAVLQRAGDEAATLADELARSADDEVRLYAVWLRAWFEIEGAPEPTDGELRLAALLARGQGGEALVKKLDAKIAALPPLQLKPPPST